MSAKKSKQTIRIGDETIEVSEKAVPITQEETTSTKELIKCLEEATKKGKVFPDIPDIKEHQLCQEASSL